MPAFDGISQFHKAGIRRIADAKQLLEPPTLDAGRSDAGSRHLRAAVYLAGYGIEYVLKEYLISHTYPFVMTLTACVEQRRANGQAIPDLRSAAGHDLSLLLDFTGLSTEVVANEEINGDWERYLRHWQSTWRYDPDPPDTLFARRFVKASERFHLWVSRRV